jgi:S1-C subfamily serine protease
LQKDWKKTIVPIETQITTPEGKDTLVTVGTGFLVGNKRNISFVVTCKHVIKNLSNSYVTFKIKNQKASLSIPLNSPSFHFIFHEDPEIDLAISAVPQIPGVELDILSIGPGLFLSSDSIYNGEEVYFLGFPLQIITEKKEPICRSGIVALATESTKNFLMDGFIFPGNSGGPVILKPSMYDFRTQTIGGKTKPYLIGIVSSYVPYREIAVSLQTKRTRIIFEENSGLTWVVPSQYIKEMIPE